ncbi:MAG: hypothetical protein JW936_10600 [Sedimentisphaerales bacterium]|nr:hypothetical protein [Sedimentisphaerales bacterium]
MAENTTVNEEAMSDATENNQQNVDDILAAASESLANINDELGNDDTQSPDANISTEPTPDNTENTLDQLADTVQGLNQQLTDPDQDDSPSPTSDTDTPEDSTEDEHPEINSIDDILNNSDDDESDDSPENNIDDILASLEDSIQQTEDSTDSDIEAAVEAAMADAESGSIDIENLQELDDEPQQPDNEPADQVDSDPSEDIEDIENIDDLLSSLADDIEENLEADPETNDTIAQTEDNQHADDEPLDNTIDQDNDDTTLDDIDNAIASMADQIEPVDEEPISKKTKDGFPTPPDIKTEDAFAAATRKKTAKTPLPNETDQEIDQVLAEELDAVESGQNSTSSAQTESKAQPIFQLPIHQRIIIQSLDAVNKPLEKFVSPSTRDTLGLVAVATLAISMAATAIFLLTM